MILIENEFFETAELQLTKPRISYRVFRLLHYGNDCYLQSYIWETIWYGGKQIEAQWSTDKYSPYGGGGIHSWKKLDAAIDYMLYGSQPGGGIVFENHKFPQEVCIGKIYSWGEVIEHEGGYRSQYAYPSKLYTFDNLDISQKLKRMYGCDVINLEIPNLQVNTKYMEDMYSKWLHSGYSTSYLHKSYNMEKKITKQIIKEININGK